MEGTNTFVGPLNGNIGRLLYVRSELNVKGNGTLEYRHGMTAGFGAVIYVTSTNSLTIQDVTLVGNANGSTFGRALYLAGGSKTKILSGTFSGYSASSYDSIDAVIVVELAELAIEDSTTKVTLNGGTYEGIDASDANRNLSDMLGTDCYYTDSNGTVDMTSVTNTTERLTVKTKRIEAVDVTITEPVVDAEPQDAVSNTDNVRVSITEWSHNGVKMSSSDSFVAGETYKVHVIVYPDNGYEFADNPTATFNGSKEGIFAGSGDGKLIYYAEFTAAAAPTEYTITVTDGKAIVGAGTETTKAAEDTTVTLTANAAPDGKVFDKWEVVSGSITLADATSATTTFTMPAGAVSVKVTYKDARNGWVKEDGKWYYYEDNQAVTGWKQISGKWYYFSSGGDMKTGWLQQGSTWNY